MNVLVTGADGQLGSEVREVAKSEASHNFLFENSKGLDITKSLLVEQYIVQNKIDIVINCAAYTAVDKAENNLNEARKVNALGVENLVLALRKVRGKIIHISTDYVFNGESFTPYTENQEVNPLGVYGQTKREGEESVLNSDVDGIILRTSWVYSTFGNNFVKTMLKLGKESDKLNVVFDQIGSPTYAKDLAEVCVNLLSEDKINSKANIYHYANQGITSWYDFAKAILLFGEIDCEVNPIETKDYPTLATRPNYSVLNTSKIKQDFKVSIPYWRDSLKKCITRIKI